MTNECKYSVDGAFSKRETGRGGCAGNLNKKAPVKSATSQETSHWDHLWYGKRIRPEKHED
jgi:hypothetical protein